MDDSTGLLEVQESGEPQPVPESSYLSKQRTLLEALGTAAGPAKYQAQIALAEFYLSYGLVPEADGITQAVLSGAPPEDIRDHANMLSAALDLMHGKARSVPDTLDARPLGPVWRVLAQIHANETPPAEDLKHAATVLSNASDPLQSRLLPHLWHAALDLGPDALPLAEEISKAAHAVGLREDESQYLTGRMAVVAGHPDQAQMFWRVIMHGTSSFSARARLDLVSQWLDAPQPDYASARDLLEMHLMTWRGDKLELDHMIALARIYEETGALTEAVTIMGRILSRFPESAAAELAAKRAQALLPRLYGLGFEGQIPFATFLDQHETHRLLYRRQVFFEPIWADMAQWLRDRGASNAAANEFAALAASGVDTARLDQARALLDGGQTETAWKELTAQPVQGHLEAPWQSLSGLAAVSLDTAPDALPPMPAKPTATDLRNHAQLRARTGDAHSAADILMTLSQSHPDAVTQNDAASLLLAAQESAAPEKAAHAATLLQEDAAPRHLAETMLAPARDFTHLKVTDTNAQLDQTQSVLDAALSLLVETDPAGSTDQTARSDTDNLSLPQPLPVDGSASGSNAAQTEG